MESIEKQAFETYQNNLNYFLKEHPEVYKKINLLNMAIESGQYQEKYALEYKDGYFDIQELNSKNYLYNDNSSKVSKVFAKSVNFSKTENVIETFYNVNLNEKSAQNYHDMIDVVKSPLYAAAKIIHYTTITVPKNTNLKKLEKYIYFGIGTGEHIKLIQEKIKSSKIIIIENNLELFRLSLFTLDFNNAFGNAHVFYSIAENIVEFKQTFSDFFVDGYNHNQYLKYTLFSQDYISRIKNIQDILITESYIIYPYTMHLRTLLKTPQYLINNYNYLNISENLDHGYFTQKPTLLLAAGPSLVKQIEWIQKNQHKFIVVCVLASLQTLYKYNIKPDIIINLDSDEILLKFLKGVDIENFLSDTIFLFSSMTNTELVNSFKKKNIFIFESTSHYKQGFGSMTTPSVGELSYGLLLTFGVKELYLLGIDLALDANTRQRYSNENHELGNQYKNEDENIYNHQLASTIAYVDGNFLDKVPTLPVFKVSIHDFGLLSTRKKSDIQNVYNLSDGAFLQGATPLKISDLDTKDFPSINKPIQNNLQDFFETISQDYVNEKDFDNLCNILNEAKYLLQKVNEYKLQKSFSNTNSYLITFAKLLNILIGLGKEEPSDMNTIMYNYFRYTTPYIFDLFNTKELTNPKKHIKKINAINVSQIQKILTIYIETIDSYKVLVEDSRRTKEEMI